MPIKFDPYGEIERRKADDVLTLARAGIPFAEARAMGEVERRAYLDALAVPHPVPAAPEVPVQHEPGSEASSLNVIF